MDGLPRAVRGSPVLFVLALAPIAVMVFWLLRVRRRASGLEHRAPVVPPARAVDVRVG